MATKLATPTAEVRPGAAGSQAPVGALVVYFALGVFFGAVLVKGEVVSWYRIQEMFRFQGIHMYGVMALALLVAAPSVAVLKRARVRALNGELITIAPKRMGRGLRYPLGGMVFGAGWALTGACPGPLFALVGAGVEVMVIAIGSATAGAWLYGYLRPRLPH
jgi:uncharacterized membrane protein YedE/YeeE